jgi:hypothetical protein
MRACARAQREEVTVVSALEVFCDEAGNTGSALLDPDQRYFVFASVVMSNDEAKALIEEARAKHPVQMPELKGKKLMATKRGRALVSYILGRLNGRGAINAHDKLLALCGHVFEYIYEPVYQDDPTLLYQKDLHRFVAMYAFLFFLVSGRYSVRAARAGPLIIATKRSGFFPAVVRRGTDGGLERPPSKMSRVSFAKSEGKWSRRRSAKQQRAGHIRCRYAARFCLVPCMGCD